MPKKQTPEKKQEEIKEELQRLEEVEYGTKELILGLLIGIVIGFLIAFLILRRFT